MTYSTSGLIGPNFSLKTTSATHKLGQQAIGIDNQCWVYIQANAAIVQYAAVGIDENFQAGALTKVIADDGWTPGAAQVSFADDDYGWIPIAGQNLQVLVIGSTNADTALFTSASTGIIDDLTTSQTKIVGWVLVASAGSTGTIAAEVSMVNAHFYLSPAGE
jgi:hypothetical protein